MAGFSLLENGKFDKFEINNSFSAFQNDNFDKLKVNKLKVNSCSCCDNVINNQEELKTAKAIALTCMDFRTVDDTVCQMNKLGYLNDYNKFVLAGASLGYNNKLPDTDPWAKMFNQHIDIAISFHNIEQIVLIDHYDCGAYYLHYRTGYNEDTALKLHTHNLNQTEKKLNTLYPNLSIKKFIISADGVTFRIPRIITFRKIMSK